MSSESSDCREDTYNKLTPSVATSLDSEPLIVSSNEFQAHGSNIFHPKTSHEISDSFLFASKKVSEGSVPAESSSEVVSRRAITIKLQIDEDLFRFRVSKISTLFFT